MKEIMENISQRVSIRGYYLKEIMMGFLLKTKQTTMVTINTKTQDRMEDQVDKKYTFDPTHRHSYMNWRKSVMLFSGVT